jgi:hypothetical protein
MIVLVKIENWHGTPAGVLTAKEKVFGTGSRGYSGTGKVEIDGKRYQAQIQLIEIGSKQRAKALAEEIAKSHEMMFALANIAGCVPEDILDWTPPPEDVWGWTS